MLVSDDCLTACLCLVLCLAVPVSVSAWLCLCLCLCLCSCVCVCVRLCLCACLIVSLSYYFMHLSLVYLIMFSVFLFVYYFVHSSSTCLYLPVCPSSFVECLVVCVVPSWVLLWCSFFVCVFTLWFLSQSFQIFPCLLACFFGQGAVGTRANTGSCSFAKNTLSTWTIC